ncbi:MAG: hypothetical protein DMG69_02465 [Acidobacteria bacterium]|nr:MAG: hypothetical protein DMG69_02465 [Acidobacteriota bacterium]
MAGLASAILCAATGFVLISLAWPKGSGLRSDLLLKVSFCVGCGLGLFSFLYFLSLMFSVPAKTLAGLEVVIFVLLSVLLWTRNHNGHNQSFLRNRANTSTGFLGQILAAGFTLSLIGALYRCGKELAANPQGTGWDAFAIWNLHARFLFRGGEHWRDAFSGLIPWFHPDYPLLLPASIAHFWTYLGRETAAVPAALAFAFTFSTVALLFSAVSVLRGRNQGLLAGVMLLGTPSFLRQGLSEYADVPLSFFLLAAIVLLILAGRVPQSNFSLLVLSGFMAACAAWTKNEGLLFLAAFAVARLVIPAPWENWAIWLRQMTPLAATIIPILLLIAYFKLAVAGPGELFSNSQIMLQKAIDPSRYWMIARWFLKDFLGFGGWFLMPGTLLIIAYATILGKHGEASSRTGAATCAWALVLTATGYFAVYVITPYDLRWHLMWSLDRLFMQLWPSVLFLVFVTVRAPEPATALGCPAPESSE